MKNMKRALYLLIVLFALCGCTQKAHVKTISENRQTNQAQKQKNKKAPKKADSSVDTVDNETNSTITDSQDNTVYEKQNAIDKKIIVLDPGHSAVVATGMEPLGPGSTEQKAADASGTSGVSSGVPEYELTLNVSLQLKEVLDPVVRSGTFFLRGKIIVKGPGQNFSASR